MGGEQWATVIVHVHGDGLGFESHLRQPIFLLKITLSGKLCCVALPFSASLGVIVHVSIPPPPHTHTHTHTHHKSCMKPCRMLMCTVLAVMVCPQVLSDVMGEEFEIFMEMLSKLQFLSTGMGLNF